MTDLKLSHQSNNFKSGFVNIIGNPNVGKSTLLNKLLDQNLSIITYKPQTTRHRILGILNRKNCQIIFSDTPGIIDKPAYQMQKSMNSFVHSTFEDADIMILMIDGSLPLNINESIQSKLNNLQIPLYTVINKVDLINEGILNNLVNSLKANFEKAKIFPISALENFGVNELIKALIDDLPIGVPYYPTDQLTDKSERFFVSEMIRKQILQQYHQEIPYSCQVVVNEFKEGTSKNGKIIRISTDIYVSRKSQKSILIGKNGSKIKELGSKARLEIEQFLNSNVFLELRVKVKDNWRDDEKSLKYFGYNN